MSEGYSTSDLATDPLIVETAKRYSAERNRAFETDEDAVDNFVEDYRFAHVNVASGALLANYLNDLQDKTPQDREYAGNLAALYKLVDDDVDDLFGDSATGKEKFNAFMDYAVGSFTDPGTLVATAISVASAGMFGPAAVAGKAASQAATRSGIRYALQNVMQNKLKRIGAVAAGSAALEAPVSAASEAQLQEIEQQLGIRDIPDTPLNLDWDDIGRSAAIGAATAGVTGGLLTKFRDPYKKAKLLTEKAQKALESTQQGRSAQDESLAVTKKKLEESLEEASTLRPDTAAVRNLGDELKAASIGKTPEINVSVSPLEGLYVNIKSPGDVEDYTDDYDSVGFVRRIEGDEAIVDFKAKDPAKPDTESKRVLKIKLDNLKSLSQRSADEAIARYRDESGPFFDKDLVGEGRIRLEEEARKLDIDTDQLRAILLDRDTMKNVYGALGQLIRENPKLQNKIDKRDRLTEIAAVILTELDEATLPATLRQTLANNGLNFEEFSLIMRADASLSGAKLADINKIPKDVYNKLTQERTALGLPLDEIKRGQTDAEKAIFARLRDERKRELKAAEKLGMGVDLWRSLLVIQPATTMRNIIGSALLTPEYAAQAAFDNAFRRVEARLLGIKEADMPGDVSRQEISGIYKKLYAPSDAVAVAQFLGELFPRIRKEIFDVFDDRLGKLPEEKGFFRFMFNVSNIANVANRQQDRYFKSAAFGVELDSQIVRKRNLGEFKKAEDTINANRASDDMVKLDSIESLIENNALELLDDEMVSKSLKRAYEITYQNRQAGDKLVYGGDAFNSFQSALNNSGLIKVVFPFPNFWANSLVYLFNRPFGGSLKLAAGINRTFINSRSNEAARLRSRSPQLIKELNEVIKREKELVDQAKGKSPEVLDELREVRDRRTLLEAEGVEAEKFFSKQEKGLRNLKEGITESFVGGALFLTAQQIRNSEFAGPSAEQVIDSEGKKTNLSPAFPLYPFLFAAELVRKHSKGIPYDPLETAKEVVEVLGGPSVRGSAFEKGFRVISEYVDQFRDKLDGQDVDVSKEAGKLLGGVIGYFLGVLGTPLRVIEDVTRTFETGEAKEFMDRAQQENLLGEEFSYSNPTLSGLYDEITKSILQGTMFESGAIFGVKALGDAPKAFTGTKGEPLRSPELPGQKQVLGLAQDIDRGVMNDEMVRVGLVPRRLTNFYSNVPQYNNVANQVMGRLTDRIAVKILENPTYKNETDPKKKARILEALYRAREVDELTREVVDPEILRLPKEIAEILGVSRQRPKNLRAIVTELIKVNKPILHELRSLKASGRRELGEALDILRQTDEYAGKDLSLRYTGETQELKKLMKDIKEVISRGRKEPTKVTLPLVKKGLMQGDMFDPRALSN